MLKILVLGGTGMAGHTIALYFKKQGHDVTILSRREISYCNYIQAEVTNFTFLEKHINESSYDAVINAVGILNQSADTNKAFAVELNSYLPHFLENITKDSKTKILQMSTDCVFAGAKGEYTEYDLRDGTTFYDRSKALGELENQKDLTFRNSIIGPDLNVKGIGLFNWFMQQDGEIKGYTGAIWSGVTTLTLAKAMEQAIIQDLTGIYHLVNNQKIDKYSLLQLFNLHFRSNQLEIKKDDTLCVDKSLICTRSDFDFNVPTYEEMIIEMQAWVLEHKVLYKHYFE